MALVLAAIVWALVGAAAGVGVRVGSVRLARAEGLEPGHEPWQVAGPVVLSALVFGLLVLFGASGLRLVIQSLWAALLVQVIFFDLEHRLILDRVLLPAGVGAFLLSFATPGLGWRASLLTGLVTGLAFLALAWAGSFVFRAEAMGLGDVKLAAFMGLILGPLPTFRALLLGMILGGVVALALVLLRLRTMKDAIPYGPFLAAGALVMLISWGR